MKRLFRVEIDGFSSSVVLIAKALFIFCAANYFWPEMGRPFLSFFPAVDIIVRDLGLFPYRDYFIAAWRLLFFGAGLCLLFNIRFRLMAASLAALILGGILLSKPNFSNNAFLVGLIFLLISLSRRETGLWLIRVQLSIVYLGAAFDKLMSEEWRSGLFFLNWKGYHPVVHQVLSGIDDPLRFSMVISVIAIAAEFALAVGCLIPKLFGWTAFVGALFHISTVYLDGTFFDAFVGTVFLCYLSFVPSLVVENRTSFFYRWRNWRLALARNPAIVMLAALLFNIRFVPHSVLFLVVVFGILIFVPLPRVRHEQFS